LFVSFEGLNLFLIFFFYIGVDYLNRLQSGVLDVAARTEAIDWILKVDSVFDLLILMVFA
jgi:hypothetical protein